MIKFKKYNWNFSLDEDGNITDQKRQLGLVVIRGTTLILFSPIDGSEEIKNPFLEQIKI